MLLQAPAGTGKTALARHYFLGHQGDKYWFQVLGQRESFWFLQRLLRSFAIDSQEATEKSFDKALLFAINRIETKLAQGTRPLLVVDGLDALADSQHNALLQLLDSIGPHVQLLLTSRTKLPKILYNWFVAQSGVCLYESALSFDDKSLQHLNEDYLQDQSLDQRILHWPLAYAEAKLARQAPTALAEYVFQAFSESIWTTMSDTEKSVLQAACLTDDFSVEYLVTATDDGNSPQALKSLLDKGLLEKTGANCFVLKPAYKAAVLNEFQYLAWRQRKSIKHRAAVYWAKHGNHERALSFCCRYELWHTAAEVLHIVAEPFISSGRFEELHKWFEQLPSDYIDHDPLLMVYRAWCFPEYQKISGAEVYLRQVDMLLVQQKTANLSQEWLKAKVQYQALKGYIARISSDYEGAVKFAQEAVAYASNGYPSILSRLYTTIGQDLYLKGDMVAAEASLMQAMVLGKQYKKHHDVLIALGYTIAAMEFMGKLSQAKNLYKDTLAWFEESGFMHSEEAAILNDLLIDVYREQFEFERALTRSDKMIDYCDQTAPALHHLVTFIRRYRLAISMDDRDMAYRALTQAETFRDILGVSWAFGWAPVPAMRAEYEMRFGSLRRADDYFMERESVLLQEQSFSYECERYIYAQWLQAKGRRLEALAQLKLIREQSLLNRRIQNAIRADVQISLLIYETDPARGLLHLRDAIKSVPLGETIVAPFLWLGKKIMPLLEQVRSLLYQDLSSMQLLNQLQQHATAHWPNEESNSILELLSGRQVTILKLLAQGHQDKIIARELSISPGTVKTHLRAIYRKLDCNNRSQAVSIAMEQGLLLFDKQSAN